MERINLIPLTVQIARARQRRFRRWAILVGATAAASLIPAMAQWTRERKLDDLRAARQTAEHEMNSARAELKALTTQSHELLLRLERANALRSKRNWSGMFSLLASALPAECWLTSLATDPDIPPPIQVIAKPATAAGGAPGKAPSANPPGPVSIDAPRRLRIAGNSRSASDPLAFVLKLKESGVFRDVVLERTQRVNADPTSPFRFEMVCEW